MNYLICIFFLLNTSLLGFDLKKDEKIDGIIEKVLKNEMTFRNYWSQNSPYWKPGTMRKVFWEHLSGNKYLLALKRCKDDGYPVIEERGTGPYDLYIANINTKVKNGILSFLRGAYYSSEDFKTYISDPVKYKDFLRVLKKDCGIEKETVLKFAIPEISDLNKFEFFFENKKLKFKHDEKWEKNLKQLELSVCEKLSDFSYKFPGFESGIMLYFNGDIWTLSPLGMIISGKGKIYNISVDYNRDSKTLSIVSLSINIIPFNFYGSDDEQIFRFHINRFLKNPVIWKIYKEGSDYKAKRICPMF